MACSRNTLAFLAALLLMALAAAAVPAGRRGFVLEAAAEQRCFVSKSCQADTCGATCAVLGINGVGVCKDDGGVPSCCCVPPPKPSAAAVGVDDQLAR